MYWLWNNYYHKPFLLFTILNHHMKQINYEGEPGYNQWITIGHRVRISPPGGGYSLLEYAKQVDSVFHALWLVTQTRDSICYSSAGIFIIIIFFISLTSFPSFLRKKELFRARYPLFLYMLRQYSPQCRWFTSIRWRIDKCTVWYLVS